MLFASELTWRGGEARRPGGASMEKQHQKAINRMGRATTGTFQSTPLGIVMAESKLAQAGPLLDYRQARFARRLMIRPRGHHGPEEILERRGAELTERLRQSTFLGENESAEESTWATHRRFKGEVVVEPRGEALRIAKEWKDRRDSIWTNGSRLEDGRVGAATVWWREEEEDPPWIGRSTGRKYTPGRRRAGWTGKRYHLGKNKEVFDAELYALYQAAKTFEAREEEGRSYTILSDSTAAIKRIRSDETGPGQRFAIAIMEVCDRLASRGNGLTVRWVPSHLGAEGNEVADEWAKMAAEGPRDTVSRRYLGKTSFAHMARRVSEARSAGVQKWIEDHVDRRRRYKPPKGPCGPLLPTSIRTCSDWRLSL